MSKSKKLLLVEEEVEQVRQLEDGLRGSWQMARVIGVSHRVRHVWYENLLYDDGVTNWVERIEVSDVLDGCNRPSAAFAATGYRGWIRPRAPNVYFSGKDLQYGLCVDALYQDGWWEGVVFDRDAGAARRSVFFPDEGDEMTFDIDQLRLSHDWDEASGAWKARGTWVFLQLIGELNEFADMATPAWVKQFWYGLRTTDGFVRDIGEWPLGEPLVWKKLMKLVMRNRYITDCGIEKDIAVVSSSEERVSKRRRVSEPRSRQLCYSEESHVKEPGLLSYNGGDHVTDGLLRNDRDPSHLPCRIVPFNGQQLSATKRKNEDVVPKYNRQAVTDYIQLLDRKKNTNDSVSKALVDRVRTEAKAHLLLMGWKFRYEWKGTRQELHYFTPEGRKFVSFYVACSAYDQWEMNYVNSFVEGKEKDVTRNMRQKKSSQFSDKYDANPSGRAGHTEVPSKAVVHKMHVDVHHAPAAMKPSGLKIILSQNSTKKDNASTGDNEKNKEQNIKAYNIQITQFSGDLKENLDQFLCCVPNSKERDTTKRKRHEKAMQVHTDVSSSRPLRCKTKPFCAQQSDRSGSCKRGKVITLQYCSFCTLKLGCQQVGIKDV
ncbi:uncharacterized protein LOC116261250 isoform X1 [Nymphaea colorata]|nr:uncharacterized protein LOC116261250 isoform X1 [Nymphaea colorata]